MNEKDAKEARLRQEIMNDAHRKAERTLERARQDVEKAVDKARRRQQRSREQAMEQAAKTAEEQYRAITARIRHEQQKRWLQRRERVIEELFADVLDQLRDHTTPGAEASLLQLLREALTAIGPRDCVVRIRPADKPVLTEARLKSVADEAFGRDGGQVQLDLQLDPKINGGVVVESADGTRRFDNTYESRLQRMQDDLRAALCAACTTTPDAGSAANSDKERQDA